jgi:hypothetical protein
MGDGIMALFGAPLALEDHAVRACYAALRMQESVKRYAEGVLHRHGVPVEIRVGLNSGEVDWFDAESAESSDAKALALAEPRGMRPLVAHCHLGLGKLYRRTGKRQEAQDHRTTATTLYREMGMRFWLQQAEGEPVELP